MTKAKMCPLRQGQGALGALCQREACQVWGAGIGCGLGVAPLWDIINSMGLKLDEAVNTIHGLIQDMNLLEAKVKFLEDMSLTPSEHEVKPEQSKRPPEE